MPLNILPPATIISNIQNAISAQTTRVKNFSSGSVLGALASSFGAQVVYLQQLAQTIVNLTRAATSTGADLTSFVADYYLNPTRVLAVAPTGPVTFTKNQTPPNNTVIPVNTIVQNRPMAPASPVQYTVIADTTNANYNATLGGYVYPNGTSTVTATVQAVVAGTSSNLLAGQLNTIATQGVSADSVTNSTDITNGFNQESDTALRVRFQLYVSGLAKCTTNAIGAAILAVQGGITYQLNDQLNVSGVSTPSTFTVVVDDGSGAISAKALATVTAAVLPVHAAGISFNIIAPTNVTMTVSVAGTVIAPGFNSATVRAAIQTALISYVNTNGVGGYNTQTGLSSNKLTFAGVAAVVGTFVGTASTQGLSSYSSVTLNGGTADVALSNYQIGRTSSGSVSVT